MIKRMVFPLEALAVSDSKETLEELKRKAFIYDRIVKES